MYLAPNELFPFKRGTLAYKIAIAINYKPPSTENVPWIVRKHPVFSLYLGVIIVGVLIITVAAILFAPITIFLIGLWPVTVPLALVLAYWGFKDFWHRY